MRCGKHLDLAASGQAIGRQSKLRVCGGASRLLVGTLHCVTQNWALLTPHFPTCALQVVLHGGQLWRPAAAAPAAAASAAQSAPLRVRTPVRGSASHSRALQEAQFLFRAWALLPAQARARGRGAGSVQSSSTKN